MDIKQFNFGLPAFEQAWEMIEEGLDTEEGRRHLGGLKAARENEFRDDPRNP